MFGSGVVSIARLISGGVEGAVERQINSRREAMKRLRQRQPVVSAGKLPPSPSLAMLKRSPDGSYEMSSRMFYRAGAVMAGVFALFWNGVISFGIRDAIRGSLRGSWFGMLLGVFMIPFVMVGGALIAATVYMLLASLHPSLKLRLEKDEFERGETIPMRWSFDARPTRLKFFNVTLQVIETLIEGTGDDQAKYSNTLHESVLASRVPVDFQKEGTLRLKLPDSPEPTSSTPERAVSWMLKVHAPAKAAPDLRFWIPLTVRSTETSRS